MEIVLALIGCAAVACIIATMEVRARARLRSMMMRRVMILMNLAE